MNNIKMLHYYRIDISEGIGTKSAIFVIIVIF